MPGVFLFLFFNVIVSLWSVDWKLHLQIAFALQQPLKKCIVYLYLKYMGNADITYLKDNKMLKGCNTSVKKLYAMFVWVC